mmetsp:Transcript_57955/g.172958  ORF Transcript_57955/g.172958 Transcript_57955/m.172958 type:complete len:149 (-) Transcript_57955:86-532(-)
MSPPTKMGQRALAANYLVIVPVLMPQPEQESSIMLSASIVHTMTQGNSYNAMNMVVASRRNAVMTLFGARMPWHASITVCYPMTAQVLALPRMTTITIHFALAQDHTTYKNIFSAIAWAGVSICTAHQARNGVWQKNECVANEVWQAS